MANVLDSVNSAIQGVSNQANDFLGGSISRPGLEILGTNLPLAPFISLRDNFVENLGIWTNSIPLKENFIILFDSFPLGLSTNVLRNLEPIEQASGFDITLPKTALLNLKNQGIVGCIFATGFDIGGENLDYKVADFNENRGFIPGRILSNRTTYSSMELNVQFRETNTSFIDFILRPWVILASHYGYVARDPNNYIEQLKNVKTNMTVIQYTRSDAGLSQIPRKTWRFYNVVPRTIQNVQDFYGGGQEDIISTVNFVFDRYEIESNLYLNISQLLKSISPISF